MYKCIYYRYIYINTICSFLLMIACIYLFIFVFCFVYLFVLIHSRICSLIHLFICSFICFTCLFIYLSIGLFIYVFFCLFIYLFIHVFKWSHSFFFSEDSSTTSRGPGQSGATSQANSLPRFQGGIPAMVLWIFWSHYCTISGDFLKWRYH